MDVVPDTCVVSPGELSSGSGKQYAVYTPWFRAWVAHVHSISSLLDLFDAPEKNPKITRQQFAKLFDSSEQDFDRRREEAVQIDVAGWRA